MEQLPTNFESRQDFSVAYSGIKLDFAVVRKKKAVANRLIGSGAAAGLRLA